MSLQQIQEKLTAPKDQYNSFAKFSYRSAESILMALKPLLAKYQYSLVINDTLELIGDRYYVKATASLYDDKMSLITHSSAYAREELTLKGQQASQITGGTSSYARKYALNALFLIDDSKDADSMDNSNHTVATNTPQLITSTQVTEIQTAAAIVGLTTEQICGAWKIKALSQLQADNMPKMISWLQSQKKG